GLGKYNCFAKSDISQKALVNDSESVEMINPE
ncbi:hypothetical protein TrispH2_005259, partial [Trichoplax sp. H2]